MMTYNLCLTVRKIILTVLTALFVSCTMTPAVDTSKPVAYINKDQLFFAPTDTFTTNKSSQVVKLENLGAAELLFQIDDTAIAKSNFSYTSDCLGSLMQNETCSFVFQFSPTEVREQKTILYITDTINNSKLPITLQGRGIDKGFISSKISGLALASDVIEFPDTTIDSATAPKKYTISNSNDSSLELSFEMIDKRLPPSSNIDSIYVLSSTCVKDGGLETSQSCDINIMFSPAKAESVPAELVITSDNNSETIKIIGRGAQKSSPEFATSIKNIFTNMKDIKFDAKDIDGKPYTTKVDFVNRSDFVIDIQYLLTDENSVYRVDIDNSTCDINESTRRVRLSASHCDMNITFNPMFAKNYNATLKLTYNNVNHSMPITGRGRPINKSATIKDNGSSAYVTYANNSAYSVKIENIIVTSYLSGQSTPMADSVFKHESTEGDCKGRIIEPGKDCVVNIKFETTQMNSYRGEISLRGANERKIDDGELGVFATSVPNGDLPPQLSFKPAGMNLIKNLAMTSTATIGQKVYFFGGEFDNASSSELLSVYDYATSRFYKLKPSGSNVLQNLNSNGNGYIKNANLVVYGNKIIQYGATIVMNNGFKTSDDIYIYDPNNRRYSNDGAWQKVEPFSNMNRPIETIGVGVAVLGDKLYIAEGVTTYILNASDEAKKGYGSENRYYYFNLKTLTWSKLKDKIENYPVFTDGRFRTHPSLIPYQNTLLIFGGAYEIKTPTNFFTSFDKLVRINSEKEKYQYTAYDNQTTGDVLLCRLGGTSTEDNVTGPCRQFGLKFININNKLYTLGGAIITIKDSTTVTENNNGKGISGPWKYEPDDIDYTKGVWTNLDNNTDTNTRGPAKLAEVDNQLILFEGDNAIIYFIR